MFNEISELDFTAIEKEVRDLWKEQGIFEKSMNERPPDRKFVFFEGPPTANGRPGIHHVLARTIKDFFCRYKTMQGFRVSRKGGWDTHGLPVEIEVEKSLNISGKKQIEEYGVEAFNEKCKESIFKYKAEWDELTERMGYWIDLAEPYITFHNNYVESVWWILKQFFDKGLIYKGFKVVPYCPKCGTPLSSHEVALGYQDVKDPSIYFRMRLKDDPATSILVWTTTPWTLISNVALAVGDEIKYVRIRVGEEFLILAKERLEEVIEGDYEIVEEMKGTDLLGREYERLFDYVAVDKKAFYVVSGEFVTTTDGTGVVHMAPAFGEDDYRAGQAHDLPMIRPVNPDGCFDEVIADFKGRFVKEADVDIIMNLKKRRILFRSEKYLHSYPHCWRHGTPLIYYARDSWYIRTTSFKERMVAANRDVAWFPKEMGEGRFGNWLENNIDWALSRDRYWGTPLNIWVCEGCGHQASVGSIEELKSLGGDTVPDPVDLHKPFVDGIVFKCDECGGKMQRTSEVIDAWFDSGSMPYAQWHYPFENEAVFETEFPADFICEGVDQTRGWFYSLMAISTFLFDKSPYKAVVVNDLVRDKDGKKMSKSLGNTADPFEMFDQFGADPLRWYMLVGSPVWLPKNFDPKGVAEVSRGLFGTLFNTYKFFVTYANIDEFTGLEAPIKPSDRPEFDRWILSRLHSVVAEVTQHLENYDATRAGKVISEFVGADLSNWYVRLSRRRFWKSEGEADKLSAYQTLFEILLTVSKMIAPFSPFLSDRLFLNLDRGREAASVHLAAFPVSDSGRIDHTLEEKMNSARVVVNMGLSLRNDQKLKVRQPLAKVVVGASGQKVREDIQAFGSLIRSELNVKAIEFVENAADIVVRRARPNFKALGQQFGKDTKAVAEIISRFSDKELDALEETGSENLFFGGKEYRVTGEHLEILHEARAGLAVTADQGLTVGIDTVLTDDLVNEGLARELVNRVQNMRKSSGFEVTDKIAIGYRTAGKLNAAISALREYIMAETLAVELKDTVEDAGEPIQKFDISGEELWLRVAKTS